MGFADQLDLLVRHTNGCNCSVRDATCFLDEFACEGLGV
jgi:hypothetical protein